MAVLAYEFIIAYYGIINDFRLQYMSLLISIVEIDLKVGFIEAILIVS